MPKLKLSKSHLALISLVVILSLLGLLFVFESSVAEAYETFSDQYHFLRQQAIRFAIGGVGFVIAALTPLKLWEKLSLPLFIFSIGLLILVLIPGMSPEINGAHRWFVMGSITIQPVEILKLSMVLYFAKWLSHHQRIQPFIFLVGLPLALLLLQPDLGSALIIAGVAGALYYLSGGKIKTIFAISILGAAGLIMAVVTQPYRMQRLTTFINPESDPLGASFHIRQITLALGSGGWFGQGIGNSKQKYSYIPEASTDSIFAIMAEEIGFIGSIAIMSLFIFYLFVGYRLANRNKPGSFRHLVGMGILVWIGLQTLLNLAAVVALIPLTGLPLPFFSYGGSSLIMILFASGILLKTGSK